MSQRGQVVSVNINMRTDARGLRRKAGALDADVDMAGGWVGGVSLSQVYPAGGSHRALMSPTVPYPPYSPTSCPCWSDVTGQLGMSRPYTPTPPPLSLTPLSPLSPLSTRLQSLASHCDPGQSMEHVPDSEHVHKHS